MLNNCQTRQLNGCHNKPRPGLLDAIVVQDGYRTVMVPQSSSFIHITVPNMKTIPNRMSRNCKYDLNGSDPSCRGCKHIGVDYDSEESNEPLS